MRVIAGDLRGRQINAVKGDNTRPTTDKIKENIFNIMGQFFDGGKVLDLFAGSGNLGIEAISRGAEHAIFVDMNFNAIKTIKENISNLKLQEKTDVYRNDAFKALNVLAKKGSRFDIIFLDPPYGKILISDLLKFITENAMLNENGLIMCEYDAGQHVGLDETYISILKKEIYGTVEITIFEKVES